MKLTLSFTECSAKILFVHHSFDTSDSLSCQYYLGLASYPKFDTQENYLFGSLVLVMMS